MNCGGGSGCGCGGGGGGEAIFIGNPPTKTKHSQSYGYILGRYYTQYTKTISKWNVQSFLRWFIDDCSNSHVFMWCNICCLLSTLPMYFFVQFISTQNVWLQQIAADLTQTSSTTPSIISGTVLFIDYSIVNTKL